MSEPDQRVSGRSEDEEAALAAESATLAEEDAADAAARASGGVSAPDGSPTLDPEDDDDPALGGDGADDPEMPIEDVDVEEGVDELGDAPEGTALTTDETADIDEQVAAIRAANAQLPPDEQISTSPEDVN